MKAIKQTDYSGISGLQFIDQLEPTLTPMTALVQTKYTPVLPYDILTEEGQLKNIRPVRLPITVGYGFTGIVTAVGALRSANLVGQPVLGVSPSGAAQEFVTNNIPPILFKLPINVGLDAAATVIGGADAAFMAVDELNVTSSDAVFVTGASGGVGSYLIQLLKLRDAHVIALTSPGNIEFCKHLGADEVVDYTKPLAQQLSAISQPTKIVDTVGTKFLLSTLSVHLGGFDLLSLSTQKFPAGKINQSFRFSNTSIGLHGYTKLLKLLSTGSLQAHIDSIMPFQNIAVAQSRVKSDHVQGRLLLAY